VGSDVRIVTALGTMCALLLVAACVAAVAHDSRASGVPAHPAVSLLAPTTAPPPTIRSSTTTTAPPVAAPPVIAPPTTSPAVPVGPNHRWAVGTYLLNLVDTSRPTAPAGTDPGSPSRSLPTIVRYPVDGPASAPETPGAPASHLGGPYPLVVFGHGFNSSPDRYAGLLHAWASAGYVVAAPSFPRAVEGAQLDEGDLANEPGDLSFVITKLLAASGSPGPLSGVLDPSRIGAAGHSDGADAALGLGDNTCCRDGRVKAVVVGEGDEHVFAGGTYFPPGSPPLLLTQGDQDAINPPQYGQQIFADARAPKYLLWLINAEHLEPFTTDQPHLDVVERATVAFFDRYLKGRPDALSTLRSAGAPGLATMTGG
jgi:dienelactone hydrolase